MARQRSRHANKRAILILLTALSTLAVAAPTAARSAVTGSSVPIQAGINGEWTTRTPIPTVQIQPASGVINGQLYVAGGHDAAGQAVAALEVYNPGTATWTAKTPMPAAINAAASAVIDGR